MTLRNICADKGAAMTVDVIILTYKPDQKFLAAMEALNRQTRKPGRIIIVNTGPRYFEDLVPEAEFLQKYDSSVIFHVEENDFDHGKTRNFAVSHVCAAGFLMMTQDAVPANDYLIENLLHALKNENVAVAYARQLPTEKSDELERFARHFNYGPDPAEKSKADVARLGIKAFFCSNVCALYRTEIFRVLGGFVNKTIFNEDMIYAKKAADAGYRIRYEPKAMVYHAHQYTYRQQMKRNFDLGVSHAEFPDVFAGLKTEAEGLKMLRLASLHLLKKGKPWLIIKLFCQSLAKYAGFRRGLQFRRLKRRRVLMYTNHRRYFENN
jgi:rhamnosyltransferase